MDRNPSFIAMSGNSMVATDREHDEHYAHRCIECVQIFGRLRPVAHETPDGDLCEDCTPLWLEIHGEDES